jgi:acetyltransferase-like isoleucine patch superfamily enzyme
VIKMKTKGYKFLDKIGIHLSPSTYGSTGFFKLFGKAIRLWKNEILHKWARNSVIFAPLNSRKIRPFLHRCRGVEIGKNVFIGLEVMFDSVYPEKIHIGNGCIITNGVHLLAHNRDLANYGPQKKISDCGYIVKDIFIEEDVVLGIGSKILPGVRVGRGAVIAAGAVVTNDVEPYSMVAGIPAKKIKTFRNNEK